jgi:hypothetical protein
MGRAGAAWARLRIRWLLDVSAKWVDGVCCPLRTALLPHVAAMFVLLAQAHRQQHDGGPA